MGKLPSFQFYPGDWMKDPGLRACSVQARGLWIDLLCLMFESPRRGYLQMASGKPMTAEHVARSTGCSPDEASRLLQELVDSGVASTSNTDGYYSRRLVRDESNRGKEREKKRQQRANVPDLSRNCPNDVPAPSSSSSSSSLNCSVPTRARDESPNEPDPTDPVCRAVAALRAACGHDVGSNWRHALTTAYMAIQCDSVEIRGARVPAGELWAKACEQACVEPGFTLGTPRDFVKYVGGIVNRCRIQGLWPHERPASAPSPSGADVSVPMSKIEQEAFDRAQARQKAREGVR